MTRIAFYITIYSVFDTVAQSVEHSDFNRRGPVNDMASVYILFSLRDGGYYVGSCRDLTDRLPRHFEGRSRATRYRLPLKLVYTKEFSTFTEAYKFERHIKKQKSKKFIEVLIDKK